MGTDWDGAPRVDEAWRGGGRGVTKTEGGKRAYLAEKGLLAEGVDNVNFGLDFNRLTIEQGWLIAPLADSGHGRFRERANSTDAKDSGRLAIFTDDDVDLHGAGNALAARPFRVNRLDFLNQLGSLNMSVYDDDTACNRRLA